MNFGQARLRIMAEYRCFPTWLYAADGSIDNPDPADLPLPDDLVEGLMTWADDWDAIYPPDDPGSASFGSLEDQHAFVVRGRALAEAAALALTDRFSVLYWDQEQQADVLLSREGEGE